MKAWMGIAALAGALASGSATAAPVATGNELLQWCKNVLSNNEAESTSYTAGYCTAVVITVGDLVKSINHDLGPKLQICVPSGVSNGQMVRILVKYLEANPEKHHINATTLTILATQQAFPCKG
nr:Rap1a/Tai family immunity protein [uncultured Pseudomonas sp.]